MVASPCWQAELAASGHRPEAQELLERQAPQRNNLWELLGDTTDKLIYGHVSTPAPEDYHTPLPPEAIEREAEEEAWYMPWMDTSPFKIRPGEEHQNTFTLRRIEEVRRIKEAKTRARAAMLDALNCWCESMTPELVPEPFDEEAAIEWAWETWRASYFTGLRMRRAVLALMHRQMFTAFQTWLQWSHDMAHAALAGRLADGLEITRMGVAWQKWEYVVREMHEAALRLRLTVMRMVVRKLASANLSPPAGMGALVASQGGTPGEAAQHAPHLGDRRGHVC